MNVFCTPGLAGKPVIAVERRAGRRSMECTGSTETGKPAAYFHAAWPGAYMGEYMMLFTIEW
jgi:hypothetical protein